MITLNLLDVEVDCNEAVYFYANNGTNSTHLWLFSNSRTNLPRSL